MSIVKELAEKYGGKWKYEPVSGQWNCEDGRYVARVHTGGYDISGEALPGFGYFLYENNKGKRIWIGKQQTLEGFG